MASQLQIAFELASRSEYPEICNPHNRFAQVVENVYKGDRPESSRQFHSLTEETPGILKDFVLSVAWVVCFWGLLKLLSFWISRQFHAGSQNVP